LEKFAKLILTAWVILTAWGHRSAKSLFPVHQSVASRSHRIPSLFLKHNS